MVVHECFGSVFWVYQCDCLERGKGDDWYIVAMILRMNVIGG